MTDETTALTVKDEYSITDIEKIGTAIAKSGLFGMRTPDQAIALCLIAHAEGQHPALAALEYDIIQNRPSLKAKAMLARFQNSGGKVVWKERSDDVAEAVFSHPVGGEITVRWDMDRAKQAGLDTKDNWKKYPRAMLSARVISEGVSTVYPGAARFYTPEEIRDFDNDWNNQPKPVQGTSKVITQDEDKAGNVPQEQSKPEKNDAVEDARKKIEAANAEADAKAKPDKEKPKSKGKRMSKGKSKTTKKKESQKDSPADILAKIDPTEADINGDELDEATVQKICGGFEPFGFELDNLQDWAKMDSDDWTIGTKDNFGKLYLLLADKRVTTDDVLAFIKARTDD